jgi:predicted ATPase
MRLKSVFISQYKNLKNFTLGFDGTSFIDVFVGKNGSGKSNLFEAVIEIFRHLDQLGRTSNKINFEYCLSYEIDENEVEIEWKAGKLRINQGEDRKTLGNTPFPNNVVVYYSGHNGTVANLVTRYEKAFRRRIYSGVKPSDSRLFIGVGSEYKSLFLAVLLTHPEASKARDYITQRLDIASLGRNLQVKLKKPFNANARLKALSNREGSSETIEFDSLDSKTRYWGADDATQDFIEKLVSCIKGEKDGFSISDLYDRNNQQYHLNVNVALFRLRFKKVPLVEVFRMFDNLKTLGMLADIDLPLTLKSKQIANVAQFSDGQFQSVYIYSIIELFKDRNCLTLLDEPDAFLHPEWQFNFLKQVIEITDTAAKNNHVLMSSHSASTLASYNERNIRMFSLVGSQVKSLSVSKKYAIDQLSSSMIKYSEDEQILSILRSIHVERKPIVFTEGSSDPEILKTAWSKLYTTPIPFIPIYAFNCVYLRQLIQDERVLNELGRKPVFALFDFDEAYNEWNSLKNKWAALETDPYKGLSVGDDAKKRYAFLLPVPTIQGVETLVIKDRATKAHFAGKSRMGIEHLFYGDVRTHGYFDTEKIPGGNEILVFKDGSKTRFAKDVVPILDVACFEVFKPMFDFIRLKCS